VAKFTIRIELHHAYASDYEALHGAMERAGFSRTIVSNDGTIYWLPTAEYNANGNDLAAVLSLAERAATTTGKTFAILVTESNGRRWSGLAAAQSHSLRS
jgi:hypothetical protein